MLPNLPCYSSFIIVNNLWAFKFCIYEKRGKVNCYVGLVYLG